MPARRGRYQHFASASFEAPSPLPISQESAGTSHSHPAAATPLQTEASTNAWSTNRQTGVTFYV